MTMYYNILNESIDYSELFETSGVNEPPINIRYDPPYLF
jgi:hypothetical protein